MSDSASPRDDLLLAYLQLVRAPNVFTAVADILMGFLFVQLGVQSPGVLATLVVGSLLLYMAGMVLNDVFDADVDAQQRPGRPIPSGRIGRDWARMLGYEMLFVGAALGWLASYIMVDVRAGLVATALAVCIWLYDGVLKQTPIGPVAMGSCRMLNVLLGMSATREPWLASHWVIAGGIGLYIAGVTWFARSEERQSSRGLLTFGLAVMVSGIALLATFPRWSLEIAARLQVPDSRWAFFWIVLAVLIAWRCVQAILAPTPQRVQAAVKNSILSLFVLDAAVCFSVLGFAGPAGIPWAIVILLLLLPAIFLGRWVYST